MYLTINGNKYTVKRRIVRPDSVRYEGVSPDVTEVSGSVGMYRNDGLLMSTDNADNYARFTMNNGVLTLINEEEAATPTVTETVESRLAKLEAAIERGLNL